MDPAVRELLRGPVADGRFSGVVLVRHHGVTIAEVAVGLADRERGIGHTPDGRFMIMSVTKQFTTALVLRLVAKGQLSLDDPVGKYVPGWPSGWGRVQVRHLLSHASGLDIDTAYFWLISHRPAFWRPHGEEEPPAYVFKPLLQPPGHAYRYSNVGFTILSLVVEGATGEPFHRSLEREVLKPLGLSDTKPESEASARARGYVRLDGCFEVSEQGTNDIVGAGDLVSSARDIARLTEALHDEDFLPQNVIAESAIGRVHDGRGWVGYGWFLTEDERGPIQSHGGVGDGFRAHNYYRPSDRLNVVVLSNVADRMSTWLPAVLSGIEEAVRGRAVPGESPVTRRGAAHRRTSSARRSSGG